MGLRMTMIKFLIFIFFSFSFPAAQVVHKMTFDRFTHYSIDDWVTYAPATHITSIDVGIEYIYFGTRDGGILRYNVYEKEWDYPWTTSSGLSSNHILDVVYNYTDSIEENWRSNVIYALTDKGIDEFDPVANYWRRSHIKKMPYHRQPDKAEMEEYRHRKDYRFPAFYRPRNSELPDFFTDRKILFRPPNEIIDEHNRVFRLGKDRVVDEWKTLWLATNGLGVANADLFDLRLTTHQKSIGNIAPRDLLYLADEDVMWVGGVEKGIRPGGIAVWNLKEDIWQYKEMRFIHGLYRSNIFCMTANKKYIFLGSDYGLVKYWRKKKKWKTFTTGDQLEADKINDLLFYKNTLFIATEQGLNYMTSGYRSVKSVKDQKLRNIPIYRMAVKDSIILLATKIGLFKYLPGADKIEYMNIGSALMDMYITAVNTHQSMIWLAGKYGIMYYEPKREQWISFTNITQYVHGKIYQIKFTSNHVWFATDSGLLKYDRKRNYWYLYTKEDGLASNIVYNIDVDGPDLWLSTENGVTVFRWDLRDIIE